MRIDAAWRVMGLAILMQTLVIGFGIYCFTFFLTPWMETFDVQRSEMMLGYTLHSLTAAILAPICGVWIDRYPARRLVMIGIAAFCLALLGMARAPSALAISIGYALFVPIGLVMAGPLIAQALVGRSFHENQGRALGIASLGTSVGGFLMPLVVTQLLEHYGWRDVFEMVAVTTAVVLFPLAAFVLRGSETGAAHGHETRAARPTGELIREPAIFFLAFSYLIPAALLMALMQNVGPIAADLGISAQQAGGIVAITALLMACGKFAIGSLSDRVPLQTLYLGLAFCVGLGMLIASTADSFASLSIAVFLVGLTAGGGFPLIAAAALRRFGPENFGRVLGIVMAIASASGLFPLLASYGRDLTGSYRAPFLALIPTLVLSALCFRWFVQSESAEASPATID
jgi:predicted MFS family arabinose efflux permease